MCCELDLSYLRLQILPSTDFPEFLESISALCIVINHPLKARWSVPLFTFRPMCLQSLGRISATDLVRPI
jgi:hypothetical protein